MSNTSITYTDYEDLEKIGLEEVRRCTKAHLPLFIPWHSNKTIPLGTFFRSNKPDDPWAPESPFSKQSLSSTPIVVERDYGSQSIFKSKSTSRATETNDHLELGMGVGAGPPFVASVTVKGDYCRDVKENKDNSKASVNFSTRAGSVSFQRQPKLKTEAIITVKHDGGLPAFNKRYGDYYVAAYRLGGDTGILVSGSNSFKKTLDRFSITVTVEVLSVSDSITHSKDFVNTDTLHGLKVIGYDTLGQKAYNSAKEDGAGISSEVARQAEEYCDNAKYLDVRVAEELDKLNIEDGDQLDTVTCDRLVKSGLVVELMLLPSITLREVQYWVIEDDVI